MRLEKFLELVLDNKNVKFRCLTPVRFIIKLELKLKVFLIVYAAAIIKLELQIVTVQFV